MIRSTFQLLRKEIRLQKTNVVFAFAVLLFSGLAFAVIRASGPKIAGFSIEEICEGLFSTAILPVLVAVLPMMMGATASAAEKALDVWPWQAALPVSRLRINSVKLVVAAVLIILVAGVLPYITEIGLPRPHSSLTSTFIITWTGWLGLLCGAIGYYSGIYARDDYQGLLLAAVPLALVIGVMWLADPSWLVFPINSKYAKFEIGTTVDYRLMIIAALFVFLAWRYVGRTSQGRRLRILIHFSVLSVAVFALTLWNIVQDRYIFETPNMRMISSPDIWPFDNANTSFTFPRPLVSSSYYSLGGSQLEIVNKPNPAIIGFQFPTPTGMSRRKNSHPFLIDKNMNPREFPQAVNSHLEGISENNKWIWVRADDHDTICGPAGLAISSALVPEPYFSGLRNWLDIVKVDLSDGRGTMLPSENVYAVPDNGKIVKILYGQYAFLWEDTKHELSVEEQNRLKMYPQSSSDRVITFSENKNNWYGILRPIESEGNFETAGWMRKPPKFVSFDYKWATYYDEKPDHIKLVELGSLAQVRDNESSGSVLREWEIRLRRPADDGSTITVFASYPQNFVSVNGQQYLCTMYNRAGKVSLGNQVVSEEFKYEWGAYMLNLKSGKESFIPIKLPWTQSSTMQLQNAIPPAMIPAYGFGTLYIKTNNTNQLVAIDHNYMAIITLKGNEAEGWPMTTDYIPLAGEVVSGVFWDNESFVYNDSTRLMAAPLRGLFKPNPNQHANAAPTSSTKSMTPAAQSAENNAKTTRTSVEPIPTDDPSSNPLSQAGSN